MDNNKISEKLDIYQKAFENNKNIDISALALQTLNTPSESIGFTKAYILSIVIPPIGVYYFFKYFFGLGSEGENKKAAIISLILTTVSLILSIWLFGLIGSSVTSTLTTNQTTNPYTSPYL